jgi:gamma-glutamyltranspeptidase
LQHKVDVVERAGDAHIIAHDGATLRAVADDRIDGAVATPE